MSDNVAGQGEQKPQATAQTSEQILVRREKLTRMRESGEAYPNTWRTDHAIADIFERFEEQDVEHLEKISHRVCVAGRMMAHRVMGKSSFVRIQDGTGSMQLFLNREELGGPEIYNPTRKWDLGDIVRSEERRVGKECRSRGEA